MHFTEPVYRNPYWPTWPLLQVTQGCSHNCCKFCTMYKGIKFAPQPMELIEQDLQEIAATTPDARTIQLLSGNPLALPYRMTKEILELIRKYLPKMEIAYNTGRVTDLRNKTVEQLRELRDLGMREVSLGVESGDDGTLAFARACRELREDLQPVQADARGHGRPHALPRHSAAGRNEARRVRPAG